MLQSIDMVKRVTPGSPHVAVAYLRASKDEQRLSADAQKATIESWAAREGVQIVAWHADQGVSSVSPIDTRPALVRALAALQEHGAGALVVAKRDRIARDVVLAIGIEREAARLGARVISASGEGNGDGPGDEFMRVIIDGAAQYERRLIRMRTKSALAAKIAKGERVGAVPFGFCLAGDGVHLVAVEKEQAAINRARQLSGERRSYRAVAAQLAAEGYTSRTGRPFAASQVQRMLNRST